ncbi:MAG: hypothetical protein D4R44_04380 [Actinobacteria bacterium]|nr:MAG: hypothetical protein D4R44_04380 [Actinomycetota bacterium]
MTENNSTPPFTIKSVQDFLSFISTLDPLAQGAKVVDQAKTSVESIVATMDNLNRLADRINKLLDQIEDPLRSALPHLSDALSAVSKITDVSVTLDELSKRLAPLVALLPQTKLASE